VRKAPASKKCNVTDLWILRYGLWTVTSSRDVNRRTHIAVSCYGKISCFLVDVLVPPIPPLPCRCCHNGDELISRFIDLTTEDPITIWRDIVRTLITVFKARTADSSAGGAGGSSSGD
jgi:hypothetical protein